jgi:hypothetical protein
MHGTKNPKLKNKLFQVFLVINSNILFCFILVIILKTEAAYVFDPLVSVHKNVHSHISIDSKLEGKQ